MSEEETVNEEVVTEEQVENQPQEIDVIKEQLNQLQAQLGQLANVLTPKDEKKAGLTNEQMAHMSSNPALAAQYIQNEINTGVSKIKLESQKQIWDQKAYTDYPSLNTDKKFQNAVMAQMNEFKNTGEYTDNHPMLVYRASQLVAGKMTATKQQTLNQKTTLVTSEAPRTGTSRTMNKSFTVSDDDPRIRMGEMMGLKKDPKKWERFKKEVEALGPRKEPERRKGRTFG